MDVKSTSKLERGSKKGRYVTESIKRLYTLKEAAEYLGRTIHAVRELIWAGKLEVVRDTPKGKQWVDIRDLENFVEKFKSFAA